MFKLTWCFCSNLIEYNNICRIHISLYSLNIFASVANVILESNQKLWYMNETTGELIDNHNHAMMWFNQGENITLLQNRGGEWVKRGSWEH